MDKKINKRKGFFTFLGTHEFIYERPFIIIIVVIILVTGTQAERTVMFDLFDVPEITLLKLIHAKVTPSCLEKKHKGKKIV